MRPFPKYYSHKAAKRNGCISCCTDMTGQPHIDFDYPEGRGKWGTRCPKCGATKFYDIKN